MSFAGTPLGQGRRLDRGTFLNKQSLLANNHPEPNRLIPASYSYSATTLGPRSPPKSTEPSRDTNTQEETDESALVRFARAKQREQATLSPQASTSNVTQQTPVDPRRWTVKDTSVNIASAFAQAALDMNPSNNDSWHSATSQPPRYSRASSVEFEQQRMQAPTNRRLADPSTRFNRKPVSKSDSRHSIPDSEGEEDHRPSRNERGKSPFNNMIDSAKRVLGPAAYYLQQRSQPMHDPTFPPREPSYDYAQEEEQFQNQSMRAQSQRKNRIPDENKAYQPSEDEFSDEDDVDEGRGRKRKGKKRDSVVGGPLSTLPVMKQDKARRRKRRNGTGELEDDSFSRSEDQILDQQSQSFERASLPPRGSAPLSRAGSVQPEVNGVGHDSTFDVERALSTVPEADEEQTQERAAAAQQRRRSRSASRGPSSRPASLIGGPLGYLVNWAVRTLRTLLLHTFQIFTSLLYLFGGVTGTMYNTVIRRPATWVSGSGAGLVKILLLTLLLSSVYLLREPIMEYLPKSSRSPPIYQAPDRPAANVAEFSDRLLKIEAILSELSHDAERARIRVDTESRSRELIAGRLGSLEGKVQAESKKAADAESQLRALTKADIRNLQRDVEALQVQLQQQQKQPPAPPVVTGPTWDEERLRALEERVGTLDAGVKEALDLGKKAATHEPQTGTPWWSKITPGSSHKSDIVIKTTDGQDISKLLSDMVDSAVSLYGKDNIGKADYALYSAGGRVIPSLTSDTMEDRPKSFTKQVLGFFTGADYPIGRPPVVALHHDVHTGYCWPFTGSKGQLGVVLALPVRVSEISVEHVASEVAFDMRTAPRDMEVWGLVEGQDNIEKVNEWQAEKRRIRREAEERGEEVEEELPYPTTLPKTPEYVRIANFTYDINAPKGIQTFPVSQEIRDLDLDFGIVVLLINNNWGREYTCLYRMRVHGDQLEVPEPSEDDSS